MPRPVYQTRPCARDIGALGFIEGLTVTSSGQPKLHYFGGLPYALPPVGPYRFRRPRQLPPCYRYGTQSNPGRFDGKTACCPQSNRRGNADRSLWDENCLQLNVYVPAGTPPKNGWPVFFYIHGGFLQFGNPNESPEAIAPLLSETPFECICVLPAYRLNAFGFLASEELQAEAQKTGDPVGNQGFWDQRLALEWTWKNVSLFGGDHDRIAIGGYSAGAHSAFHQLAHELYFVPDNKAIIKQVCMWSNSPGVQPKTLDQHQKQFDEYLQALGIPLSLPAAEKLAKLRAIPPSKLVEVQDKLALSEFRALSDGRFVAKDMIANINSGDFAARMKRRGIRLMNGENKDEGNAYALWRTPSASYSGLHTRLCADYPESVVRELMRHYCGDSKRLPAGAKSWQDLFGKIYADMQVHALQRGFHNALFRGGLQPGKDVLRYRFNKRMRCVDGAFPPVMGVTHGTDLAVWWFGLDFGDGLTEAEKREVKTWIEGFAAFVKGEDVRWGGSKPWTMRRLTAAGQTDVVLDDRWQQGLALWEVVNGSSEAAKAKL